MSLWAAVFDGVAGKAEFTGITFSDNTDIEMKVKFTSLQTGGLLSDGLAGRYFRYGAGSFRFRSSSTTYPTWVYTPVVDQFYDIMVECRSGGVELFIDGVSQGIKSGAFGTFNIDTIALFNGNLFADVVIERLKITDNTTASNSIDLFNEVVAGSSVDWPDVSANNKTITLVDTATDGSQWELIGGGGGVTVTELLNNSDSTSSQDSILLSGLFNVIDDAVGSDSLSSIDNISLAATVNISDEKDDSVSASNEGGVKFSGAFNVGELANNTLSLSSFDSIQLAASIVINETESSSLSESNNDTIKLIGQFNVIGEKNNTSSVSNIDLVSFTSTIIINDNLTNTDSISNLDGVSFIGKIVISDMINDSSSLSATDSILLAGAVSIGDTLSDTKSLSIFDSIQVGEFIFNVNTETNVDGIYLAINVNGIYYSTNLNG